MDVVQRTLADSLTRFSIFMGLQKPVNLPVLVGNFGKQSYVSKWEFLLRKNLEGFTDSYVMADGTDGAV